MTISGLAVGLVVATGLTSAGFDLYQKILSRWLRPVEMVFWLGLASIPLFAVGTAVGGWPDVRSDYWGPAVVSVILNLAGHIAFVQAVRVSDLSKTVPLLSLTPVVTTVIEAWLLGESPDALALFGIVLVVVGAFWLHSARGAGPRSGWLTLLRDRGAWLMIATAVAWSITIPLDRLAVERAEALFHGLVLTVGMTLGAALLLLRHPARLRPPTLPWRPFLFALFLCTGALVFQLLALTQTLAGIVETGKRGLANLMALIFGRLTFDEDVTASKLLSIALMAAGVALILIRPA